MTAIVRVVPPSGSSTRADMPVRALVLQHAPYCPLGMLGEPLQRANVDPHIVRLDEAAPIPNLEAFDALIVLGGPQDVWQEAEHPWLVAEKGAIQHWVRELDRPALGICLGHQLIADALGGEVGPAVKGEAGLGVIHPTADGANHALMKGFGPSKRAIQFHGAEVKHLPADCRVLATSPDCPIAAFAACSATFGIQYHAEATAPLFEEWTDLPLGRAFAERIHGAGTIPRLRREVAAAANELQDNADALFHNFLAIAASGRSERSIA